MATITDKLNQLISDRDDLVDNLTTKGITGLTGDETFTELVPEVLNIPSGGGSVELPTNINLRFTNSTTSDFSFLENIDTSNLSSASYMFDACTGLTEMPTLDTSNVTEMIGTFRGCTNLTTTKLYNTSKVTIFWRMHYNCSKMTTLPQYDTSSITSVQEMCSGCSLLENVPIFDLSGITNAYSAQNWFQNCPNLTNESLNNIMASLLTLNISSNKTLSMFGISRTQATTCTTLSNWSALQSAGWTTGY